MGINIESLKKLSIDELSSLSDKELRLINILLLRDLVNSMDSLREEVMSSKVISEAPKVYTDEEIYKLKQSLSWSKLSIRTGIPVSTLQSRYRKYIQS